MGTVLAMTQLRMNEQSKKWGSRQRMREASLVLRDAVDTYHELKVSQAGSFPSIEKLKAHFAGPSRAYYSLAAMSRRAHLDAGTKEEAYKLLFPLRALLETRIIEALQTIQNPIDIVLTFGCKSFFGKSIKQGVSVRYPLSTCIPTLQCAGRCYAHDGRDRDYQRLFRGALNGLVGLHYERNPDDRHLIISQLSKQIDEVIALSRSEAFSAAEGGYRRKPRIRFSHVGEMAATPTFANDLAAEIRRRDPEISCVIYTRHPEAKHLDPATFVVNFTVEGAHDKRIKFRPAGSRLVSSSWDGHIFQEADVNFLEHHVEKSSTSSARGSVCPVTVNHKSTPTCDSARCERCFVQYRPDQHQSPSFTAGN
jgi:hypothetical protein